MPADPPPPQAADESPGQAPTGLPGGPQPNEDEPLGVPEARPEADGEGEPARGKHAMPGIPTEGEPPSAG